MQRWRWVLWLGGIAAALAAGTMGFRLHFRSMPDYATATFSDCLYGALRLFVFEYDGAVNGPKPFLLEAARFLSPLLMAWGALRVGLTVFRDEWDGLRLRFIKRHAVVCGLGDKGFTLARDLLKEGAVVGIENDASCSGFSSLRDQGALCLEGDAREQRLQAKAGLEKASFLVAAAGDDHQNLAVAMTAVQMSAARPAASGGLTVLVHIADPILRDLLQRSRTLETAVAAAPVRVRFFNRHQNAARLLLKDHPLEFLKSGAPADEVHLVLCGMGPREQALLLQIARVGHYRNGRKVHVHILAPDAEAKLKGLESHYENLARCVQPHAQNLAREADFIAAATRLGVALPAGAALTVFLRQGDESDALATAVHLAEALLGMPASLRILLPVRAGSPMPDMIGRNETLRPVITVLPEDRQACGWKAVYNEEQDRAARAIHEAWRTLETERLARQPEAPRKPAFKPWDELSEEQKDANRAQADFLAVKIRAAGSTPATAREDWPRVIADPAMVETLARMEHERWCAAGWLAGWTYDAHRNDAERKHDDLVPYDRLDEPTRQFDRDTVLKLPDYLPLP